MRDTLVGVVAASQSLTPCPFTGGLVGRRRLQSVPAQQWRMNTGRTASSFFAAIEAGDIDTVRRLYTPDALVWHNTDDQTQDVEENLRVLAWMARHLRDLRYDDVRRTTTGSGFVQQHVLRARRPDGVEATVPACIVATCRDGRISRIDEYLDSAHVAALVTPTVPPTPAT